jgi:ABC-type proline/glycine betaine transport system substrate-binding protein
MCSDEEVKKTVEDWFNRLAEDFYHAGVQKFVTRYKCLNLHGDKKGRVVPVFN